MPPHPTEEKILIFTRYPLPGKAKTRLIPALGKDGAADLQKQMTEHALAVAFQCAQKRSLQLEIVYTDAGRDLMAAWLGDFSFSPQCEGNLGERLAHGFSKAFQNGCKRVVAIGCDCPDLTPDILANAFDQLRNAELVLGPTLDGGYYLIGLKRFRPQLFLDIPWGTDQVLATTLSRADAIPCTAALLQSLADVDRPSDLRVFSLLPLPR